MCYHLTYIFYLFQYWNLLEKGFFCRRFHRLEGPLQKSFLQIQVEQDLKILVLKFSKKWRETVAAPKVSPDEPVLTIRPWIKSVIEVYLKRNALLKFIQNVATMSNSPVPVLIYHQTTSQYRCPISSDLRTHGLHHPPPSPPNLPLSKMLQFVSLVCLVRIFT